MEPDYIETARLMARFQQQVRRSLNMAVDLDAMARDPGYARRVLSDVEGRAREPELRATLSLLRDRLAKVSPLGDGREGAVAAGGRMRFIRFGGRSE